MTEIVLAENLSFDPSQAATQRHAFIAGSGGGKTYAVGRFVEQLFAAECPSLVFDTVGVWPSIRLAADGKSPGLPFAVFGGDHADVPIDLSGGRELARVLVSKNASAVIDVSGYLPRLRAPFAADFFEELLLAVQKHRRPRMLVVDEMQDVAPERGRRDEDRMLQAVAQLARKGRNYSLGTCQVTQRPQDVAKAVLNQVESLFVGVLRTKHERQAISDWIAFKSSDDAVLAKLADLPSFQPGEFLFYSPSWLKRFERIKILPKWTHDGSSANPLDSNVKLGKLAPVDVAALRAMLAPVPDDLPVASKHSNGSSPEHTRLIDEIDDLRARLDDAEARAEALERRAEQADGRALAAADRFHRLRETVRAQLILVGDATNEITAEAMPDLDLDDPPSSTAAEPIRKPRSKDGPRSSVSASPRENADAKRAPAAAAPLSPATVDDGELDSYSETLVAAIKAYAPLTRRQLSLVTGVSGISSTFSTALGKLHADGWVKTVDGKLVAGEGVSVGKPRLERGRAVRNYWRTQRLDDYSRKLLDAVFDQRAGLTRKELAAAAAVSGVSSTFSTALGRMKRAGIFTYTGGKVTLSPDARWAMLG